MNDKELIGKAWYEHRPYKTYDTEGIEHLIKIAISLARADEREKCIEIIQNEYNREILEGEHEDDNEARTCRMCRAVIRVTSNIIEKLKEKQA